MIATVTDNFMLIIQGTIFYNFFILELWHCTIDASQKTNNLEKL